MLPADNPFLSVTLSVPPSLDGGAQFTASSRRHRQTGFREWLKRALQNLVPDQPAAVARNIAQRTGVTVSPCTALYVLAVGRSEDSATAEYERIEPILPPPSRARPPPIQAAPWAVARNREETRSEPRVFAGIRPGQNVQRNDGVASFAASFGTCARRLCRARAARTCFPQLNQRPPRPLPDGIASGLPQQGSASNISEQSEQSAHLET